MPAERQTEPNAPLVLQRRLRKKYARSHSVGCAAVVALLLLLLAALVAPDSLAVLWVLVPILLVLIYFVVSGIIKQRRELGDESRWVIERAEYRARQVWRVLSDPEDGNAERNFGESFVFREEGGGWGVAWPIAIEYRLAKSMNVDWKNGVPASITVDFIKSYDRIGEIRVGGETVAFSGTFVLSGPSVLRADEPVYRVERFEDLPPELVRQFLSAMSS